MIEKEGYAFIAGFASRHGPYYFEPMFGPTRKDDDVSWNNIESNDLTFFSELKACSRAGETYLDSMSDCSYVDFAKVSLKAAETEDELEEFRDKKGLMTICFNGDSGFPPHELCGPILRGRVKIGVLPAMGLSETNYALFNEPGEEGYMSVFDRAYYSASELSRQGGGRRVTIGQLFIDRMARAEKYQE